MPCFTGCQQLFRVILSNLFLLVFLLGLGRAQTGSPLASTTTATLKKSNQSKVFYHDGSWWTLAFHEAQGAWYLWKYNGSSWSRTNKLELSSAYYPDVVLNAANNKLFIFSSHHAKPKFRRYSYAAGSWNLDAGFPQKNFTDFVNADQSNPVSLIQAKNGDLWLFRIDSSRLQAKRSTTNGSSWNPVVTIKSGLNHAKGTSDAVAFTGVGGDYVGVGYAESGNGTARFGFLLHRDGDAESVWTDESVNVAPLGTESAQNNLCMAVDGNNHVYLFVRSANGDADDPRNALYKRAPNGSWSAFVVNSVASGVAWQTPALTIDGENGRLYLFGRNLSSNIIEYKTALLGQEHLLASAAIETALANGADVFGDATVPAGLLNATTDLLITAGNTTADDVWFNKLDITAGSAPVVVNSVNVNPTTAGLASEYAITFQTSPSGGLAAGSGTITVSWPEGTTIPAAITPARVTVNGIAAAAVTTNPTARQAIVTVATAVPAHDTTTLVFASTANIVNPATAGNYTLQVATSAQPLFATSPVYEITTATSAARPVIGSGDGLARPNQNRVFYHDGFWWLIALNKADQRWKLWRLQDTTWTSQLEVSSSNIARPDCFLDGGNNRLYILLSHTTQSTFLRLTYNSGSWSIDAGYPTNIPNARHSGDNPLCFTRARNGELWVFGIGEAALRATYSTNEGVTWSNIFVVKSGLHSSTGMVDCLPFSAAGNDYVGVAYGEDTVAGAVFGFLRHQDGAAHTAWTDESTQLSPFAGTNADDQIALAAANDGTVYLVTKTSGGDSSTVYNGLYKRLPAGTWQAFAVNRGSGWSRPAVALDESNHQLYLFGHEATLEQGVYKQAAYGDEGQLDNATTWSLFAKPGVDFDHPSLAPHNHTSTTGLLVVMENETTLETWYRLLSLGTPPPGPLTINSVTVSPTTASLAAAYTINLSLGASGGLAAGVGTLTITWPNGTTVPATMSASQVTVNGTAAAGVTTEVSQRRATVTVPNTLNGGAVVNLIFALGAGLVNPATAGSYTLEAFSSAQPSPSTSPAYTISEPQPVTVNAVTVSPTQVSTAAAYTIPIVLGSQGALNGGNGTITVTWPAGTRVPSSIAAAHVTVNGVAASAVVADSAQRRAVVTVPANLAANAEVTLVFDAAAHLINPDLIGNYTLQVFTSQQTPPATSPAYALNDTTPVLIGEVNVVSPQAYANAAYTIPLTLGLNGELTGGSGTITVTWPAGTIIPSTIAASHVTVNGVAAQVVSPDSVQRRVVVTVPQTVMGNASVSLVFATAAGLINPPANSYTLTVFTSAQTNSASSPLYQIIAQPPVTVGTVSVSPDYKAEVGSYSIPLILGPHGSLAAGSGTISVTWPFDTSVPASISSSHVTVNGVAASAVTTNSAARQTTVTVPSNLAGNAGVTLTFAAAANIVNPTTTGSYSLGITTSKQDSVASSPAYSITNQPPVVVDNITVNPTIAGEVASYTIPITVGAYGGLTGGSGTITVTWPSGTTVPASISASNVTVNGVSAAAVSANSATRQVTVTVPNAIGNNASVTLVFTAAAALVNPGISGDYSLMVHTSRQTAEAASPSYTIDPSPNPPPPGTGTAIDGTGGEFDKPHQSRLFYHDGKWWLAGLKKSENKWKLWKFDGSNWIDQGLVIGDVKTYRPDCFVNNAANKLYIFVSGGSKSQFLRLSYSGGAWSKDSGYPVNITHFTHSGEYSISFSRAVNGELWAFRVNSNQLEGIVSSNEGVSWSGVIVLKSGLNNTALTDCHAFSAGGNNYMGVCYSENSTTNSIVGFLRHQDGSSSSSWTDESSSLPPYSGTRSDDHINMAVADDGTVYLITKTDGGGASIVDNGLYRRSTNGTWQLFAVNRGGGWTRPALAIDQSNNQLYAIGAPEGTTRRGYYKRVAIGSESSFESAASVTIFEGSNNYFVNPSVAQHNHSTGSGLMIAIENDNEQQLYYNKIAFAGAAPPPPVTINSVNVSPATAGVVSAYSIAITLGSSGSLSGGSGTITVTWPANTSVPATIANSAITVNGLAASNVATNPANRFAVVTVPANLPANANVTLEISAAAGITNPTAAGNYTLQVKTSAQPSSATSPVYNLQVASPVVVDSITVQPDTTSRVASYQIPLTLGSQGALSGGSGTITVTWPNDTSVPVAIATAGVTVNGVPAAAVTTTPAARRAVITVPNTLANNAAVTLFFSSSAGIVNPTSAGAYTLQVQTSSQPVEASSPTYNLVGPPPTVAGSLMHANSKQWFDASNQSKLFHHDGSWWLAAYDRTVNDWYLWKYNSGSWTRNILLEHNENSRIDLVSDSGNNRFFGLASLNTGSLFGRFGYNSGTWTVQSSATLTGFTHDDEPRPVCLVRGNNGQLWVFRINAGNLEARQSSDNGNSWSALLTLKSGIAGNRGMVDAVKFTSGGVNYVGVFYGMLAADGGTDYGFLKHDDNAAATTWSEESSALTFFGNERADARISAMAAADGTVYLLTANSNAGGSDPANTLYRRGSDGTWSKFKVNTADGSEQWRSPALAIDGSNNRLYVMGIRTSAPNRGQYKMCNLGAEATLETQTATLLFANGNDNFDNLSAPAQPFSSATGLMVAAANLSSDVIWYNQVIAGTAKFGTPQPAPAEAALVEGAQCYPNPFNPATTIRFVLAQNRKVRLQIFNLRGELVRTLVNKEMPRGVHEVRWNGRDKAGRMAASGIYFYRLDLDGKIFNGSMQMIK